MLTQIICYLLLDAILWRVGKRINPSRHHQRGKSNHSYHAFASNCSISRYKRKTVASKNNFRPYLVCYEGGVWNETDQLSSPEETHFRSAPWIATFGAGPTPKSAIPGLLVKSDKSDWLRIRNEYFALRTLRKGKANIDKWSPSPRVWRFVVIFIRRQHLNCNVWNTGTSGEPKWNFHHTMHLRRFRIIGLGIVF